MSSDSKKKFQFREYARKFDQIIDILKIFQKNIDKKFNFTKLIKFLDIPSSEEGEILRILFRFQKLFNKFQFKKIKEDNKLYLVVPKEPKRISFSNTHIKLFSDIIYTFNAINRGKGFDIKNPRTKLLKNLKQLQYHYPFLFESNGNGLIYPSVIGLDLGNQIISYNKSSQSVDSYTIQNYIIEVTKGNV